MSKAREGDESASVGASRRAVLKGSLAGGALLAASLSGSAAGGPAVPAGAKPTTKTARFRELLQQGPFYSIAVEDVTQARLVEAAGFAHIIMSSHAISHAIGIPDLGLVSATETIDLAARICDATRIPMVCDLEDGKGTALNVYRWIQLAERAGAAGVYLTDADGHDHLGTPHGRLAPTSVMVDKVKAAVDARRDSDFVITVGSLGARESLSEQEALTRAVAYAEAGADVIGLNEFEPASSLAARDVLKKPLAGVGHANNVARLKASGITLQFLVGFNEFALAAFSSSLSEFKTTGDVKNATRTFARAGGVIKPPDDADEVYERARKYHVI